MATKLMRIQHRSDRSDVQTQPLVQLINAAVTYGTGPAAVAALEGIDLTISPGDSVAVMGPSGSGKSTLLRLLGHLDAPTSGAANFPAGGSSMTIFQDHMLVPFLTIGENLRLAAEIHRSTTNTKARVGELLDVVGIGSIVKRMPHEVSGGERQRAAVAQALIVNADLILADEPTGALDEANSRVVAQLLASLAADYGIAVVVATHSATVSAEFDKIIHLNSGKLVC